MPKEIIDVENIMYGLRVKPGDRVRNGGIIYEIMSMFDVHDESTVTVRIVDPMELLMEELKEAEDGKT